MPGIYKIEKDKLTLMLNRGGVYDSRPKNFDKPDLDLKEHPLVLVLERVK